MYNFQFPSTPIMEGIVNLHNYIMFYLILIFIFVLNLFFFIFKDFYFKVNYPRNLHDVVAKRTFMFKSRKLVHGTFLEFVWTIAPGFVLLSIAFPSFSLLYAMDEAVDPLVTLKVVGHQWYWSYQWSCLDVDPSKFEIFDSYMLPTTDLLPGQLRLLKTDNPLLIPVSNNPFRVIVTSDDVLHSWAVPAFGIKIDSVPGRLNQVHLSVNRPGIFYGQCSELCGVNHGFMPIEIYASLSFPFKSIK